MPKRFTFKRKSKSPPQGLHILQHPTGEPSSNPVEESDTASKALFRFPNIGNIFSGIASDLKLPDLGFKPSMKGFGLFVRHLLLLLRNGLIWAVFASVFVGLGITMRTGQAPWHMILGRSTNSVRPAIRVWHNDAMQFGPDHLINVTDDRSLLAMQITQNTGNILRIDAVGDVSRTASVLFKDFTLVVGADNRSTTWLHRGNKLIQKFDNSGDLIWQRYLDFWPDAAWYSEDGYVLILMIEAPLQQKLTLYSPTGTEIWEYELRNVALIDAAVSLRGSGVALSVISFNSTVPQCFGYLLNQHGQVISVSNLGDATPRSALINRSGSIAVIANSNSMVILYSDTDYNNVEIPLQNPPLSISLSDNGSSIAVATLLSTNPRERNRSEVTRFVIARDEETGMLQHERLWSYQLREVVINIELLGEDNLVYLTTPEWLRVFDPSGEAIWGIDESAVGAGLQQTVISPSGDVIGVLDNRGNMSIWRAPIFD
jgi:hypothetical protein